MRVICTEKKELPTTEPKVTQFRLQTDGAVDPVSFFTVQSKDGSIFEAGAQYDVAFTKVPAPAAEEPAQP